MCTASSSCDAQGACTVGAAVDPDDGNPCTADSCDPAAGVQNEPVAPGTSCDDGNLCNGADICGGGCSDASTVLHYRFEEGSAGQPVTTLLDSGPHGLHAPVVGELSYGDGVGGALSQVGVDASTSNGYAQLGNEPPLNFEDDLTIEAFVRPRYGTVTGGTDPIFRRTNLTADFFFREHGFYYEPRTGGRGTIRASITLTDGFRQDLTHTIFDSQWSHVALVMRDTRTPFARIELYIDGGFIVGRDIPGLAPAWDSPIGSAFFIGDTQDDFQGDLDELRITRRALSPAELLTAATVCVPRCESDGPLDVDDGDPCTIDSCDPLTGPVQTFDEDAPLTCAEAGYECGPLADGCGQTLDCGSCPTGATCGTGPDAGLCLFPQPRTPTRLVALAPQLSSQLGHALLSAQLLNADDTSVPMAGLVVEFTSRGETYLAVTDATGVASVDVAFEQPGAQEVGFVFAGDATYEPSFAVVQYITPGGEPLPIVAEEPVPGHAGTRFVLAYGQNGDHAGRANKRLDLYHSPPPPPAAPVRAPGAGSETTVVVDRDEVTRVDIPVELMTGAGAPPVWQGDSGLIEDKGIEVTADAPVTVKGLNFIKGSTDGFLALPTDKLGTEYIVSAFHAERGRSFETPQSSQMVVVATQDGTRVTVIPSADLAPGPALPGGARKGRAVSFTLGNLQTLQLTAKYQGDRFFTDLTGTTVDASAPVAVFGGNTCTIFGGVASACDHMHDPMPPLSQLGEHFVIAPPRWDEEGQHYRVTASADDTDVWVDSIHVATLQRGQVKQLRQAGDSPHEVTASAPVLVTQHRVAPAAGDPDAALVAPIDQYLPKVLVVTPEPMDTSSGPYAFDGNYLAIVAEAAHVGGVRVDGTARNIAWRAVGSGRYAVGRMAAAMGQRYLIEQTVAGSGVFAFAHGDQPSDSYLVTSGMALGTPTCHPTATEPGDGLDNDCDGLEGEELANGKDDDGDGLEDEDLALEPTAGANRAPVLHSGWWPQVRRGRSTSFALPGHDPDGDALSYRVESITGGGSASLDGNLLTYESSPTALGGSVSIQLSASDGVLRSAPATLSFTRTAATALCDDPFIGDGSDALFCNKEPRFVGSALYPGVNTWSGNTIAVPSGQLVQWTTQSVALDNDLDPLSYSLAEAPAGMTVDADTGVVQWTVGPDDVGSHPARLVATDPYGGEHRPFTTIQVVADATNVPPTID
ncbi:MAG: putative Ig domain-containing protein, partial [Myxococcales bacterium]|nr:putative Ig domain-containing protein [Myxococcales bacterium]